MMLTAAINGFGRFGLHLLKYWLDRNQESHFVISAINDDRLSIREAYDILVNDPNVVFNKYKIKIVGDALVFHEPNGAKHVVSYTNNDKERIPWKGQPDMVFECSGKNTSRKDCEEYLVERTNLVVISATSWDADATLIFGFNHSQFAKQVKIVSYGSCTVNAYVPFAAFVNKVYGVIDSDVNVIHNIQAYRLKDNNTLNRKFCTLEKSGVLLLDFLNKDNFTVNYTVVPYSGVSMFDFRFRLKKKTSKEELIEVLEASFSQGVLKHLYAMDEVDVGPEVHNCSTYSAVFIKEGIRVLNDNVYLQCYFDNENSVNRFYDLVNHICLRRIADGVAIVDHDVATSAPVTKELIK